jgi:hypothetical protein
MNYRGWSTRRLEACLERRTTGVASLVLVLLTACGDPLVPPELISSSRVLAARVEAVQDPERAWLAPGERGRISWLIAGPEGPPVLGWACSLCATRTVSRGLPRCAGRSFAQFTSVALSSAAPRFEFALPDEQTLAGADQIALFAAFCASGVPVAAPAGVEPSTTRCPDPNEHPLLASMELPLRRGTDNNVNPSFEAATFSFDGEIWPELDELADAELTCDDRPKLLPSVRASSSAHTIELRLPSDLSEPLQSRTPHSPSRETLQLAHFTTGGDLERAYSTMNVDGRVSLTWTHSQNATAGARPIRFYFVLRDGRGGLDWRRRALCVLP